MDINKDLSPEFLHGAVAVGATAIQVVPQSFPILKGLQLKAGPDNEGTIHIGGASVTTTTGFPLEASEGIFLPIEDISKIFAVASQADQDLFWCAL